MSRPEREIEFFGLGEPDAVEQIKRGSAFSVRIR